MHWRYGSIRMGRYVDRWKGRRRHGAGWCDLRRDWWIHNRPDATLETMTGVKQLLSQAVGIAFQRVRHLHFLPHQLKT